MVLDGKSVAFICFGTCIFPLSVLSAVYFLLLWLQRVIKSDVERTRARLAVFRDAKTRRMMEQMLTFYCKSHGLKYKQGLNELLGEQGNQSQRREKHQQD